MLKESFFYLWVLENHAKKQSRVKEKMAENMALLVDLSKKNEKVTTKVFLLMSGLKKSQFQYASGGISGLFSDVVDALVSRRANATKDDLIESLSCLVKTCLSKKEERDIISRFNFNFMGGSERKSKVFDFNKADAIMKVAGCAVSPIDEAGLVASYSVSMIEANDTTGFGSYQVDYVQTFADGKTSHVGISMRTAKWTISPLAIPTMTDQEKIMCQLIFEKA